LLPFPIPTPARSGVVAIDRTASAGVGDVIPCWTRKPSPRPLNISAFMAISAALGSLALTLGGGCGSSQPTEREVATFPGVRLTVAVVEDETRLPTLRLLTGEWAAARQAEAIVAAQPIQLLTQPPDADVLLFPGDRMGELVDLDALIPLPERVVRTPRDPRDDDFELDDDSPASRGRGGDRTPKTTPRADDPLDFEAIAPGLRDRATRYGRDRMALPYSTSVLVLVYRIDRFADPTLRAAAQEAGVSLDPPRTWEEFDRLAAFLHHRDWSGDGQPDAALAVALGPDPNERIAVDLFLARAGAVGRHRDSLSFLLDYRTLQPRLTSPPFVDTLEAIVSSRALGPEGIERFDANAARAAFREGRVALLIDRAEMAPSWSDPTNGVGSGSSTAPTPTGAASIQIGVAPLPGSQRVFNPSSQEWERSSDLNCPTYLPRGGGWLIGIASRTSEGPQRQAAIDLARFLAGRQAGQQISRDRQAPALPTRPQGIVAPLATGLDLARWGRSVTETLTASQIALGPRFPAAPDFLADLEAARLAALEGQPAAQALAEAAQSWTQRIEQYGRDRLTWHYSKDLIEIPVADTPPPRASAR